MSDEPIGLTVPLGPPPSLKPREVIDLGAERELRELRKKTAELEARLAVREGKPIMAVIQRLSSDEKHGYQCGFHQQVEVSFKTPEVTCSVCGEKLDPIEVLREFVKTERNFAFGIESLQTEKKVLENVVAALKREKNNLASVVRRRGGKPVEITQKAEHEARWGKKS